MNGAARQLRSCAWNCSAPHSSALCSAFPSNGGQKKTESKSMEAGGSSLEHLFTTHLHAFALCTLLCSILSTLRIVFRCWWLMLFHSPHPRQPYQGKEAAWKWPFPCDGRPVFGWLCGGLSDCSVIFQTRLWAWFCSLGGYAGWDGQKLLNLFTTPVCRT